MRLGTYRSDAMKVHAADEGRDSLSLPVSGRHAFSLSGSRSFGPSHFRFNRRTTRCEMLSDGGQGDVRCS
jgi:hypothetical protein